MSTYKPSTLRNSDRNAQILKAVESGMSYSEVAEELGTTRCVVAGVCRRAGLKTGRRHQHASSDALRAMWSDPDKRRRVSAAMRRSWARLTPEQRKARRAGQSFA